MRRLVLLLALLIPMTSAVAHADATKEASPIVRGVAPGLLGIGDMAKLYDREPSDQIRMTPRGRLTLFPGQGGNFLVTERKGNRLRNFAYTHDESGKLSIYELSILRNGTIFDPGSKVLRGAPLKTYLTNMSMAFIRTNGRPRGKGVR